MRDIGKNIRALRVNKKITQEELAELLCVTRQTVSNYENGRSRPDIDMVLRIAQALDTDANAVIYGPPIPEERIATRRKLIISISLNLIIGLAFAILYPMTIAWRNENFPAPYILTRLTLLPTLMFVLGWTFMYGLELLLNINLPKQKWLKYVRICLIACIALMIVLSFPYIIWLLIAMIQQCSTSSVSMNFPYIPIYHQLSYALLAIMYKSPYIFSILGFLSRLVGLPAQRNEQSEPPQ